MTSSDPTGAKSPEPASPADASLDPVPPGPNGPTGSQVASETARILAAGHLHPGVLFLRMVDGLRSAILPLILGLLTDQSWLLVAVPIGFVLMMVYAIVRYLTFRYVLTEDELVTTEGVLHRQERRIPTNRIQDLSFEASLLRRVFGLVVVSVETASGQGSEANLDSLGLREAANLRESLHWVRTARGLAAGRPEAAPSEETVLYRATASELTLLGLTNNRAGALLVAALAMFELADQFGFGDRVIGAGSSLVEQLAGFSPSLVVVIVVATLFLVLLAGWLLAIVASFVRFHGFVLSVRDDVLQRRFGLITTRTQTLPRRRVQRVLIEQRPMRRLLGLAELRADSAGSGNDDKQEQRSGRDIIAPALPLAHAEQLVPWLLLDLEVGGIRYRRVSAKLVTRLFAEGALLSLAIVAVGWSAFGAWALLGLLGVPFAYLFGSLAYLNMGYAELDGYVAMRWGIVGSYRAILPLHKVQAAKLEAGPVDRLFGLASLVVYVAGGSPTRLRYLARGEAERLEASIASGAAARRFVW